MFSHGAYAWLPLVDVFRKTATGTEYSLDPVFLT